MCVFFAFQAEIWAQEKVGALGRIEPEGGIIDLVGPGNDKISTIVVREGEFVKKNDAPLIIFESKSTYELEVSLAELAMKEADELGAQAIAMQKLKIKEADELGKKTQAAQELTIIAAKAEYDFALSSLNRFVEIGDQSVSAQQMDERKSNVKVTKSKLDSATQELKRLTLKHEIDVALARQNLKSLTLDREIKLKKITHELGLARTQLKQSTLRAPVDGTILEILKNVGESTGGQPVIRMADLEHMNVIAEIFESDLLKITPGLKATITSKSLPDPLTGKVESIGRIISGSSRTAKVKIRLDDPKVAAKLINLEVDVSINF